MGRVDLSRYRAYSLSNTPPVPFPDSLTSTYQQLSNYTPSSVTEAISTFRNASTQRDQVQAIKRLGHSLRDAHVEPDRQNKSHLPCSCGTTDSNDRGLAPLCVLAAPLLSNILFNTPSATGGLAGAALRAVLLCRAVEVEGFDRPVDEFLQRLEAWGSAKVHLRNALDSGSSVVPWFQPAAEDVSALATILSEKQSSEWVLGHSTRMASALRLTSLAPQLFCQVHEEAGSGAEKNISVNSSIVGNNISAIERACDSSVKAAQDIIAWIIKSDGDGYANIALGGENPFQEVVESCARLLQLTTVPRSCALACAVVFVSGLLYRHSKDRSPEALATVLQEHVIRPVSRFPRFSQLSLLRAIMEGPAARPALPLILYPPNGKLAFDARPKGSDSNRYVFDQLVCLTTASADAHLRFLAMDALIACVRRRSPEKLDNRCRDTVLKLVSERLQEPIPGISAQVREAMEALISADGKDEESTKFWVDKAAALLKNDWLSRGIYAPLGVLVGRIGALQLLESEPYCQSLAMDAAGIDARLAKPVADWLTSFWKVLWNECRGTEKSYDEITLSPLAQALVHESNSQLRERVSEHMIPAYFRAAGRENMEDRARRLLRKMDEITIPGSTLRVRGTVTILSVARAMGVFVGSFSDPAICSMVDDALCSCSEDIRSSALDLVVTSKTTTAPLSAEEFQLLRSHLPVALMPVCSAGYRSRFRHSMRRLFERLSDCRRSARDGSGGWWVRERKARFNGMRTDALEDLRLLLLNRMENFEKYCSHAVLSSTYPGAPFARRTNALNLANLLSSNLGFQTSFTLRIPSPEMYVSGLLSCVMDEWERPRQAAMQVMSSLSDPVPGFESVANILKLQQFALPLLLSPRQREVDSGAAIYRCVFLKHVMKIKRASTESQHVVVLFSADPESTNVQSSDEYKDPGLSYAESVLDSLEIFTEHAEQGFLRTCKLGLFHGHCLVLRYIVQDLQWRGLSSSEKSMGYRDFVRRLVNLYRRCTSIAMKGIRYTALSDDYEASKGADDSSILDSGNILLEEPKQLVSTSCFLSMKEICVSLGILCHEVMSGLNTEAVSGEPGVISVDELRAIGDLYIHVFTNTRHWGVIDGASEGLQLLCEKLLQASRKEMRDLPQEWIAHTLSLTLNGELYVLRRSAGIPHLISSIVNAEATLVKRSYDSPLLDEVMTTLLTHLENAHMFTRDSSLDTKRSRQEEGVAHALNLLRALFLNGNISTTVLNYLESTTMYCIRAFCSASWLIRNSALMLFSALVRRGVGVCLERKAGKTLSSFEAAGGTSATLEGERRLNGVTAVQFFARYPKLHPFLLNELVCAVKRHDQEKNEDHPALFPTLYLLSSLSPSLGEDPNATLSMGAFRGILRKCVHWRSNYVRRAAAAACVPLLEDPGQVAQVIDDLLIAAIPAFAVLEPKLDEVHRALQSSSVRKLQVSGDESKQTLRQNHLHGDLLMIGAILNGMSRSMSLHDKAEMIKRMARTLPDRLWVAENGNMNPSSVTRSSMLSVIQKVYDISREVENVDGNPEDTFDSCRTIIDMCKELDVSQLCFDNDIFAPTALVGLPAFQERAARFLVHVTMSSYEKDEISAEAALKHIKPLISCDTREVLREGLDAVSKICEEQIEDRRNQGFFSGAKILAEIWTRCHHLIENCRYQDVVVATLRLMTILLDQDVYSRSHQAGGIIQLTDSKIAASLLDTVESHNCVDIRESGIILVGQLMKTNMHNEQLVSRWILFLELMTSAHQPPSSKIAACVSFDRSALGSECWETKKSEFVTEMAVQGLLRVSTMSEDDHADVRTVALQILHRCQAAAQTNDYPMDTLPTLMSLFELLSARFSHVASLLGYMSKLLSANNTAQDVLMEEVGAGKGTFAELQKNLPIGSQHVFSENILERRKSSRLFRLEEDTDGSELVLRMQLICWCYRKAILSGLVGRRYLNASNDLVMHMVLELQNALADGRANSGNCVLEGTTFTAEGFARCYQSILRLLIAISFLQAEEQKGERTHMRLEHVEVPEAIANVAGSLAGLVKMYHGEVHPAIVSAIDGIRELLHEQKNVGYASPEQRVLFLLRV